MGVCIQVYQVHGRLERASIVVSRFGILLDHGSVDEMTDLLLVTILFIWLLLSMIDIAKCVFVSS